MTPAIPIAPPAPGDPDSARLIGADRLVRVIARTPVQALIFDPGAPPGTERTRWERAALVSATGLQRAAENVVDLAAARHAAARAAISRSARLAGATAGARPCDTE